VADIKMVIDGNPVVVPDTATILEAATQAGIQIPTLCHVAELKRFTSCYMCVVQVEGLPRPVPSCSTQVGDGMVVHTNSPAIRETRRTALELLVSDHCGDCYAPCHLACPTGIDIQGFLKAIAEGNDRASLELIKDAMPLPASLGRICPHPCETECRRNRVDEPLGICWSHRFVADKDLRRPDGYVPEVAPETGHKVAVVGAGPAGLSAAYHLRRKGHAVTIFEMQEAAGGMLRWGIPYYRLPAAVLDAEIKVITDMGVEIRYGQKMGRDFTIGSLKEAGYEAIFLGLGAQEASRMRVDGEDLPGVWSGLKFLAKIARGESVDVGDRVLVVGGGNTAIDSARTARRLGAKEVVILYRRTREEMPALDVEIEAALQEGIQIEYLTAPVSVQALAGELSLTCQRMELGAPDASGRRRPVPVKGSEYVQGCTTIISAIGQRVDMECLEGEDMACTLDGRINVDPVTGATSIPGVFAGGDCVTGPDIAVRALGAGRLAAASIDQMLNGRPVIGYGKEFRSTMGALAEVDPARFARYDKAPRVHMPELSIEQRVAGFDEVELGLEEEQARKEAKRCLECGCAAVLTCKLKQFAGEYGAEASVWAGKMRGYAYDGSHPDLYQETGKCIQCGACVRACRDVRGLEVWSFVYRGFEARVLPYFGLPLGQTTCDGCLDCVKVCPTGALVARRPERLKDVTLTKK
jgi:formate dehydrogenase major subunit